MTVGFTFIWPCSTKIAICGPLFTNRSDVKAVSKCEKMLGIALPVHPPSWARVGPWVILAAETRRISTVPARSSRYSSFSNPIEPALPQEAGNKFVSTLIMEIAQAPNAGIVSTAAAFLARTLTEILITLSSSEKSFGSTTQSRNPSSGCYAT